jgi:hypothetical protein
MRPLAVDLVLLRAAAPDLPLVVGRVLAARVVERHDQYGVLNLAGAYLTAELPDEVQVGDRLRLVVRELTAERVVMQIANLAHPPSGPQVPPALAEPLAAGRDRVTVLGREEDGTDDGGEQAQVVTVRFEGKALGTVELRVALDEELVHVRAALASAPSLQLARERAGALRSALVQAAGRPAEVDVVARPERLDVYV